MWDPGISIGDELEFTLHAYPYRQQHAREIQCVGIDAWEERIRVRYFISGNGVSSIWVNLNQVRKKSVLTRLAEI